MARELKGIRLHKWLADAGLCSRREGERWILAGRVAVNGEPVTTLGTTVTPRDRVAVDGQPVRGEQPGRLVVAINKPRGVLCTRSDPQGRPTVFGLLPKGLPRLILVGRLDYNSEGLLLLTTDGLLAHRLMHPSHQVSRTYKVKVHGRLGPEQVAQLAQGVTLEDGPTGPLDVSLGREDQGANTWLTMTLHEGRNRLVRRIFESLGMEVARLLRVEYGGVQLEEMAGGNWRPLNPDEVELLRRAAGFPAREGHKAAEEGAPPGKAPPRRSGASRIRSGGMERRGPAAGAASGRSPGRSAVVSAGSGGERSGGGSAGGRGDDARGGGGGRGGGGARASVRSGGGGKLAVKGGVARGRHGADTHDRDADVPGGERRGGAGGAPRGGSGGGSRGGAGGGPRGGSGGGSRGGAGGGPRGGSGGGSRGGAGDGPHGGSGGGPRGGSGGGSRGGAGGAPRGGSGGGSRGGAGGGMKGGSGPGGRRGVAGGGGRRRG